MCADLGHDSCGPCGSNNQIHCALILNGPHVARKNDETYRKQMFPKSAQWNLFAYTFSTTKFLNYVFRIVCLFPLQFIAFLLSIKMFHQIFACYGATWIGDAQAFQFFASRIVCKCFRFPFPFQSRFLCKGCLFSRIKGIFACVQLYAKYA